MFPHCLFCLLKFQNSSKFALPVPTFNCPFRALWQFCGITWCWHSVLPACRILPLPVGDDISRTTPENRNIFRHHAERFRTPCFLVLILSSRGCKLSLIINNQRQANTAPVNRSSWSTIAMDFTRAKLCCISCNRVSVCLSVCPSQAGIVLNRLSESSSIFGTKAAIVNLPYLIVYRIPHCIAR